MGNLGALIEAHKFNTQLKEEVDPKASVMELLLLKNDRGMPFFVYLRLKPSEYMEYRRRLDKGEVIDPNQYEILEYGWGEPSQALKKIMEEKHGVDHEYENTIRRMLDGSQKRLQSAE